MPGAMSENRISFPSCVSLREIMHVCAREDHCSNARAREGGASDSDHARRARLSPKSEAGER